MLTPLPHQVEDAQAMSRMRFGGNFSGMGSGKTITTLEALRIVRRASLGRTLIIAPPIALPMWAEITESQLSIGAAIVKTGKAKLPAADVIVMSYAIATARAEELAAMPWLAVICDESHALKSVTAKRTKAVLGKNGIVHSAKHAWMLTGTPMTRWTDDLYPFLCRADLGGLRQRCGGTDMTRFQLRYCITQLKAFSAYQRRPVRVVVGSRNETELNSWLYDSAHPLAVRRELKDVWDSMPALSYTRLPVRLDASPELRSKLKELRAMSQTDVERGLQNKDENMATLRRELGQAKVKAAVELLYEQVDAGSSPILVGAWHREVIDALVTQLRAKGLRVESLDGRTSSTRKERLVAMFNGGHLDVLVGQIAAMGVSLNLQAGGNRIVVVEEDWSPSVMEQFYARLHRMGQTKAVHVDTLVSDTKLDEAVYKIGQRKKHSARVAVGVAAS